MDQLNSTSVFIALGVVWVLVQIYNSFMTAKDHYNKSKDQEHKPVETLEIARSSCMEKFRNDKNRIDRLEVEVKEIKEGQKELITGVRALIAHAIHNGNKDELQKANDSIDDWLVKKTVK